MMQIRETRDSNFAAMLTIINDAAQAYHGLIPADCWREPYMSATELRAEIADGVVFGGARRERYLVGVMGIQGRGEVALVRHAYVSPAAWRMGIGTRLLEHVLEITTLPVLVGTWAAATRAISFYQRNGFSLVSNDQKDILLLKYWSIPQRQVGASVVLADQAWLKRFSSAISLEE